MKKSLLTAAFLTLFLLVATMTVIPVAEAINWRELKSRGTFEN